MLLLSAAQLGFAFVGCAGDEKPSEMQNKKSYDIAFRVIDSVSGDNIEGVSSSWGIITYLAPGDFTTEDRDLEKTNDLGLTFVKGALIGHSFKFEKDGYFVSRCLLSSEESVGLFYKSSNSEGAISQPSEIVKLRLNEPITVKLVRRTAEEEESKGVKRKK